MELGAYRWELGPATIRYYWTVNVGVAPLSWLRCGEGQCGVDPSLTIGVATGLQCRLGKWAPAHTQSAVSNYSGLLYARRDGRYALKIFRLSAFKNFP